MQRGIAAWVALRQRGVREHHRGYGDAAVEEVIEAMQIGVAGEARIAQVGQVRNLALPWLGDRRPVIVGIGFHRGRRAIRQAHAEAHVAQHRMIEVVLDVGLPRGFISLALIQVFHGERPVVVVRIGQVSAVRVAENQLGHAAGQVQLLLRHLHAGRHGGVEAVGLGLDVLHIGGDGPAVMTPAQVPRQVGGVRLAVGATGIVAEIDAGAGGIGQRSGQQRAFRIKGRIRREADIVRARLREDRLFVPCHLILRFEVGQGTGPVILLPLQRTVGAFALAVEFQCAPLSALRCVDRIAVCVFHRVVRLDLEGVGAGGAFRVGQIQQRADFTDRSFPAVGHQAGIRWRGLALLQFRPGAVSRDSGLEALVIERHRGTQVDQAADRALDLLGRRVLVDVDASNQLRRHVFEVQRTAAVGGERIAAIEFGAHVAQAADRYARALDREVLRVALGHGAVDGHAHDALQHFRHRAVRQLADIVGDDGINDFIGILFDLLRRLQRCALAGHHHRCTGIGRGGLCERYARHGCHLGEAQCDRCFLKLFHLSSPELYEFLWLFGHLLQVFLSGERARRR